MNNPASTALAAPNSATASVLAQPTVSVDVIVDATAVRTTIVESDREVVQTFATMQPAHRGRLVESAWSIGLRAAMTAHRLAGESRLEDVGQRLVEDFTEQLDSHQEQQQAAFARALAEYFDPKDGRVPARIEEFVRDGGELARTMAKYLSADGELAKVLARSFGEASPLMKRLSPTDSEGVIQVMEKNLRTALQNQQTAFAAALDPSTENGALARFFVKLKADLKAASDDRDRQLAVITKSLDTNDKTSAMSRFFAESRKTYADLLKSMNPEDPATPLGSIKSTLTRLLEKHAKEQQTSLALIEERQRKDGQELREALARFEVRRRVEARSAAGGATFEGAVAATVGAILRGAPATVETTGSKVGLRTHCKKGDVVVRFSEDHRYAGTAIVIEAKHDASFTVPKALEELEAARANRGASSQRRRGVSRRRVGGPLVRHHPGDDQPRGPDAERRGVSRPLAGRRPRGGRDRPHLARAPRRAPVVEGRPEPRGERASRAPRAHPRGARRGAEAALARGRCFGGSGRGARRAHGAGYPRGRRGDAGLLRRVEHHRPERCLGSTAAPPARPEHGEAQPRRG
jgi:hypothetical protein